MAADAVQGAEAIRARCRMTEGWWLTCGNPAAMLRALWEEPSDRKLRLYGCACCRRIWHWLQDERSRQALEFLEDELSGSLNRNCRVAALALASEAREVVVNLAYANGQDVFHPTVYAANAVHSLAFFSSGRAAAIDTANECAKTVAAVED